MADAFIELQQQDITKDLSHAEWLALLIDREMANRNTKRVQIRLRAARLRHGQACVEDVDYRAQRQLDKGVVPAACHWPMDRRASQFVPHRPNRNRQVVVGMRTCSQGLSRRLYRPLYARAASLRRAGVNHGDGRFPRLLRILTKVDLLILDDWGPERLSASQRRDLMEIIEERHGRSSTLITSQLPVEAWHEVIAEPTFADAILDRIVHNAYRLCLNGPSMRKTQSAREAQSPAATASSPKPAKGARK